MIVAKWRVPCVGCDRPIEPGEQMGRASDGSGWVHVYCNPASKTAAEEWQRDAAERVLAGEPGGWVA